MRKGKILVLLALFVVLTIILTVIALFLAEYGDYAVMVAIGLIAGLIIGVPIGTQANKEWTLNVMKAGAQIAIESANNNDKHDAAKIGALSHLLRESMKQDRTQQNGQGFPPLLSGGFAEADFTIEGLDDE